MSALEFTLRPLLPNLNLTAAEWNCSVAFATGQLDRAGLVVTFDDLLSTPEWREGSGEVDPAPCN